MKTTDTPVVKDLVLVGGGHAHVGVLRRLAMKPVPGLRVTLVARDIHTPYSGMLPGYIAGHYSYDDCHIDLGRLARFAGARLYRAEVERLDLQNNQVLADGRPPIHFDLLSVNTGSRPGTADVPGAAEYAIAVKPIDLFLQQWEALRQRALCSQGPFRIAVVGGGAGGVELLLAVQHRLRKEQQQQGLTHLDLSFALFNGDEELLQAHAPGVRRRFSQVLQTRQVEVHNGINVAEVRRDAILLKDGSMHHADAVLWVTSASTPDWPGRSGLATDEQGFIRVNEHLQSVSHPYVFAAGDVASLPDPRPKSGVFAVRQGPVLTHNLVAGLTRKALKPYRPQKNFLGLISTGDEYAVASRGNWSWEGAWLWTVKDWIDRRFMRMFNELPEMPQQALPALADGIADHAAIEELSRIPMRCGGCGAKVGATLLSRVLAQLPVQQRGDVLIGRDEPDDAAMLQVPPGMAMVQSVDYFRAFVDDPYLFGAIAANHALGDLYAMGAEPQSALALATVPYGREAIVEHTLQDLLAGAVEELQASGAVLAGGHSSEGAELAFGLTVNGLLDPAKAMRKAGLKAGDALILTKPLGTGTLLAADMRHKARGRWVDNAMGNMRQSSLTAAKILQQHEVRACTDVTGFGLLGHLLEMLRASSVDAQLQLSALPVLDGALQTVEMGILSSLQPANLRLRRALLNADAKADNLRYPLLFDPQTAGGLLFGIAHDRVEACLQQLHSAGYVDAVVIGQVTHATNEAPKVALN